MGNADHVREFYDRYAERQTRAGVNERHRLIRSLALEHGLVDGMNVLEMGCGIGTLTSLLVQDIPNGKLLAVDLSPVSIGQARSTFGAQHNLEFRVADVVSDPLPGPFDMIVLPDILEHIPYEHHAALFGQIRATLAPKGRVLIHSPDPFYLEWLRKTTPEVLQVVDLPLHLKHLSETASDAELVVQHYQRHCIWTDRPDYFALVLEHVPALLPYHARPAAHVGFLSKLLRRLQRYSPNTKG
ncbi:MAG: class I SAM-dependent methyltransferase [Flavobacteriales bacterium]|nr:class I SAM-dependent methyltransferase [Flavobacteriales bacterium]